uniref:Fatty acid desaturase domain-containing protein n=1 Tax=Chaetoceros debilis TaxID=122233 RepID=A0A7S3QJG0_9STRA|mmetsp:Transcript_6686/g.9847  ORF Transcript_6686/g.9847 Transcript_6686/m.9847 type:complete len:492 (+) Transcript_6686:97-1572(+)
METLVLLCLLAQTVSGFQLPVVSLSGAAHVPLHSRRSPSRHFFPTRIHSTIAKGEIEIDISKSPVQYECDENVDCTLTPCPEDEGCRTSLDVRIHKTWYNLSGWRKAHPAGSHWIDSYDGRDATEVMDAMHSEKAKEMYKRLPKSDEATSQVLESSTPLDTDVQMNFRKLRTDLEGKGWFEREYLHEFKLITIVSSLFVGAASVADSVPLLSTALLSLAFTNAGWIGHDYMHGVDEFSNKMKMFSSVCGGLGKSWWNDKHNNHHAHTNEMGIDGDMAEGPLLFSYAPDPANDSPMRKIQHFTMPFTFSLLFLLWRFRSLQAVVPAVEEKRPRAKEDLYALMVHYFLLLTFIPVNVWVPAMFMSGLMTAFIVTPTHQSDAFFNDNQEDWVTAQFKSTRNAVLTNPFSTWLWGGMQYQLEHHLFPTMPRSQYPKLKPIIEKFAAENGLEYLESGEVDILRTNWELYRDVAKADPVPGAPAGAYFSLEEKIASA